MQDVVRFTNNIEDDNRYFPRGGPGNRGGEGEARYICCSAAVCSCVLAEISDRLQISGNAVGHAVALVVHVQGIF